MSTTYPNEIWPADAVIQALDGTTDQATGLPYVAKGTGPTSVPSYEVQYNRRLHRQNRMLAAWRRGMVVDEGGLKIGVYAIDFVMGGYRRGFAGASGVSIPDDSTRVVYLDSSAVLQTASVWPSDMTAHLPLARVITSNGQMTIEDCRTYSAYYIPTLDASNVRDRRIVTAHRSSVGASESDTEVFEWDPAENLTLEEIQVYCSATAATASVDVKENGSSVLTAAATPAAGSIVKPAISDSSISAGNNVTVHVTTDGTGSIADLTVTLLFKAALAS